MNDVFYFCHITHRTFIEYLNLPPISDYLTGTSLKIKAKVHVGHNLDNAFWDKEYVNFGDGHSRFFPLTSLDVVAHEISHAFTDDAAQFHYRGMSAGLDESFSDVAGILLTHERQEVWIKSASITHCTAVQRIYPAEYSTEHFISSPKSLAGTYLQHFGYMPTLT